MASLRPGVEADGIIDDRDRRSVVVASGTVERLAAALNGRIEHRAADYVHAVLLGGRQDVAVGLLDL